MESIEGRADPAAHSSTAAGADGVPSGNGPLQMTGAIGSHSIDLEADEQDQGDSSVADGNPFLAWLAESLGDSDRSAFSRQDLQNWAELQFGQTATDGQSEGSGWQAPPDANGTEGMEGAEGLVVTTTADVVDASDGEMSLREALILANTTGDADLDGDARDTITFANGVGEAFQFGGTITLTLGELTITEDVVIDGDLDGDGTSDLELIAGSARVFGVEDSTADLAGLTITGGGLRVGASGTLNLTDSTVSESSATNGGGILNAGTANLEGVTVSNNQATRGGGIYSTGFLTLTDSTVSLNRADASGAGIANRGTAELTNTTLSDNTAEAGGGGFYNAVTGDAKLTNTTLAGNDARVGGGAFNFGAATLTNVTLAANSAAYQGGGVFNQGNLTAENSLLLGNSAALGSDLLGSLSGSSANNLVGNGSIDPSAVFESGALADNGGPVQTLALKRDADNLALDAGNDAVAPQTDARGLDRRDLAGIGNDGSNVSDLGALELQQPPLPVRDDTAETDEDTPVRILVLANDGTPGGETFTVTAATDPDNGEATVNPDGSITYAPDLNFEGEDTFTYTAESVTGETATAEVTVSVMAVNDPPLAVDDAYAIDEDSAFTAGSGNLPGVLANDTDVEDDDLFVVSVLTDDGDEADVGTPLTLTSGALLTVRADGSFDYDTRNQFDALGIDADGVAETFTDSFTYRVSDGSEVGETATATITVSAVNDAPEWTSLRTNALDDNPALPGETLELTGLFTDPDTIDTHSLTIDWGDGTSSTSDGTPGDFSTLELSGGGSGRFTAEHAYAAGGVFTVTVTVTDNSTGAATTDALAFVSGARFEAETGELQIVGTEGNDFVFVTRAQGSDDQDLIAVASNALVSTPQFFDANAIEFIWMDLGGGDDIAIVSPTVDTLTLLVGASRDDQLIGGGAGDLNYGADGNDDLVGGPGDDILFGRAGDDLLFGSLGNDLLVGGEGFNVLTGGAGVDLFVIGEGTDLIADFQDGTDLIGLAGGFAIDDLTLVQDGDAAVILSGSDVLAILEQQNVDDITNADIFIV